MIPAMKTSDAMHDDPLFELELKVARRADELAHDDTCHGRNALELWCEAEREVLDGSMSKPGAVRDRTACAA
jgi:hypothetical protein